MRDDILKLISQIQVLAIQITEKTGHDVDVKYSGHTELFALRVYEDGWTSSSNPTYNFNIYLDMYSNSKIKDELIKCKKVLEEIK